jgi:hypothetical protein
VRNDRSIWCTEASIQGLKHQGPLEWHHLPTKSHESLPDVSKADWGGGVDRHRLDGVPISLFPFLESRLKKTLFFK